MENKFIISSSPHLRHKDSTKSIMRDVIIALLPACFAGIYFFGIRTLLVMAVTVAACVVSEFLCRKMMKREQTIQDLSAVVTGLLLALNLPPQVPIGIAVVGGAIAIFIVKQLFGGMGQNFMNPALTARAMLLISWPVAMTKWMAPRPGEIFGSMVDAVSTVTPIEAMEWTSAPPSYLDMFLGNIGGCIGEISKAAILLGAIYLFVRRIIQPYIPVTFIGTVALFTWIFGGDAWFTGDVLGHVLSGGLIFGAVFMATDYTTSPLTRKGKIIFGIGAGIITSIIRLWGGYPEGVSFAILLMNVVTPLIDRYTVPRSFGGVKHA